MSSLWLDARCLLLGLYRGPDGWRHSLWSRTRSQIEDRSKSLPRCLTKRRFSLLDPRSIYVRVSPLAGLQDRPGLKGGVALSFIHLFLSPPLNLFVIYTLDKYLSRGYYRTNNERNKYAKDNDKISTRSLQV